MDMKVVLFLKAGGLAMLLLCALVGSASATELDVYLVAGQSNCDGRGDTNALTGRLEGWSGVQTNVLIHYTNPITRDPDDPTYETGWTNLMPGFAVRSNGESMPSERFGLELSFGKMMAASYPDRNLALIKVTRGGTTLYSDWNPDSNGFMWQTFTNKVTEALQELTDAGDTYNLKGMIWHQGESDIDRSSAEFTADLTHFLAEVRSFTGDPELPVVLGELTELYRDRTDDMTAVAATDPYTKLALATDLETNLVSPLYTHFDALSLLAYGRRYAALTQMTPTTSALVDNDKIVFFGDSITAKGVLENGYVTLFSDAVAAVYTNATIEVIGAGVSGDKMADLQARLDEDVLSYNPSVVVIYGGINDVWHWTRPDPQTGLAREGTTPEAFEAGLTNLIQRIEAAGARGIICTPTVISESVDPDDANYALLEEYATICRSVAAEADCQLIDLRMLFTDYLLLNNTDDAASGILTADTVHMNDTGNALLAEAFEDALGVTAERLKIGNVTFSMSGTQTIFGWNASADLTYTLQSRTNLMEGSWSNRVENIPGADGAISVTNRSDQPASFYRIIGN
jgi:lysophospholipase L1-like esterase